MSAGDFSADYFDGHNSRRRPVLVEVAGDMLAIRGDGIFFDVPREKARVLPRLGETPLRIGLPGGGLLVALDFDKVDASLGVPRSRTLAHRLESHTLFVILALAAIVVGAWFAYRDGIPWASKRIAERIPVELEAQLADQGLESLDRFLFRKSTVPAWRRESLTREFTALAASAGAPPGARLEFRNGGFVGANALTLPGGLVVITDQLTKRMDDRRLAAILAHELGHVHHRHGMRLVLDNSLSAFLMMAVFGDVSAVASVAATVPTVFVNTGYSRDYEREADAYALRLLAQAGRSPRDFVDALDLLRPEGRAGEAPDRQGPRDPGYLSTHPDIEERMQAAEDMIETGRGPR
ncbi:MAG: M48 family metallopeptidase [Betaproteobacteria bacterium]|nr:M48 family metallopeptidase [Betaproteobacteria bacterium]